LSIAVWSEMVIAIGRICAPATSPAAVPRRPSLNAFSCRARYHGSWPAIFGEFNAWIALAVDAVTGGAHGVERFPDGGIRRARGGGGHPGARRGERE